MAPVIRKPAVVAALGMASPSAQEAGWGSAQAICTPSVPRRARSDFSSGTLLTCNDQLHTPTASGGSDMAELREAAGDERRYDARLTARRAEGQRPSSVFVYFVRELWLLPSADGGE